MSDDLKKMIEAVEAGIGWHSWGDHEGAMPDGHLYTARNAYHGSLDSAKALHDSLLPGWTAVIGQNAHHKDWCATVRFVEDGEIVRDVLAGDDNPARAWLLAILKAKLQEDQP